MVRNPEGEKRLSCQSDCHVLAVRPLQFLWLTVPLWPLWVISGTFKRQSISGVHACLLYILHLQLHKWQNVYYSCGIDNWQLNIKIRSDRLLHAQCDRWLSSKSIEQIKPELNICSLCLWKFSMFWTNLTALHSPGTERGSSLCARSRSWALLCPWRWWCLYKSTCSPESGECDSSPPSPTGETRWVMSRVLILDD